jgi:hypothetical protein
MAGAVAVLVAADLLIGAYQDRVIERHRALQARVERMAWKYVRVDVDDVGYTADGKYRVRLVLDNLFPEYEIFVMTPSVQGYVQVGPRWQEVKTVEATEDPRLKEGSVVHLRDQLHVEWVMDIPMLDYFQAFPGYMHIQLESETLVSDESQPKEYVAERNDVLFFHLKPLSADDRELKSKNRFPGEPPIYIPTVPRR